MDETSRGHRPDARRDVRAVSLNEAGSDQLSRIRGLGARTAEEIVRYREEHGPFESFEQLLDVPVMTQEQLEALRRSTRL